MEAGEDVSTDARVIPSIKAQTTKDILRLGPDKLHLTVQFITGHCTLQRHLSLLQVTDSSRCRLCEEEEETPLHLINSCPATWWERNYAFEVNEDKSWLWKMVTFVTMKRVKNLLTVQV